MGWFTQLCRNTGLMIHHAIQPLKKDVTKEDTTTRVQVNKTVEEEKTDLGPGAGVTLRRTTIEEIEFTKEDDLS